MEGKAWGSLKGLHSLALFCRKKGKWVTGLSLILRKITQRAMRQTKRVGTGTRVMGESGPSFQVMRAQARRCVQGPPLMDQQPGGKMNLSILNALKEEFSLNQYFSTMAA